MLHSQTTRFVRHFASAYPMRSATMVAMLAGAGLLEGIGVLTMLPLLEVAAAGGGAEPSRLSVSLANVLGAFGLTPSIGVLLTIIVTSITAKAGLIWLAMRQVGYTVAQVTTDLRLALLRTLMRASWSYYTSQSGGQIANAISSEAHRAAAAYRSICVVIAGALQILAYLAVAYLVSWRVALATLAIGGLFLFLLRGVIQLAREAGNEQTDLMRSLVSRLTDALRGIKPVRAMGREDQVLPLLERETEALNQALRKQVDASEALRLFQEPTLTAFLALGLFLALVVGDEPFASVLVLAFIFYRLMTQVNTLQMRYQVTTEGESAFWSLQEQIDKAHREREPARGTLPPPPLVQGILLEDVDFQYEDAPVLRGLTLEIPAGAFVALYGPSGAGKTTIADLILGLHRPTAGTIEIDGVPLEQVDISAWRKQVGYVPQEVFLFHDTVLRNVTLGDPSISRDSVERALRDAGVWSVISSRPEGMDEVLGEAGSRLSGGQRQRISIARALVHEPKLLILDEATTALDPATERSILESLQRLRGEVTILAISHQPALSAAADIVYSLEGGGVKDVSARGARA